ncbi:TPA: hypothetical protein ACOEHG_005171 [Enterobacter ludwigii]
MFTPFKWDPNEKMTYDSENASQVIIQNTQNFALSRSASFDMNAPGEILMLRANDDGGMYWQGPVNVRAGTLRLELPQGGEDVEVYGAISIGGGEKKSRLEITFKGKRFDEIYINTDVKIGLNGEFYLYSTGILWLLCNFFLEKNAVVKIITTKDIPGYGFFVSDNSILEIVGDSNVHCRWPINASKNARVNIFADYLDTSSGSSTIDIDFGCAEVFVGGVVPGRIALYGSQNSPVSGYGFNFITVNGDNYGLLIVYASCLGVDLDDVSKAHLLTDVGCLMIDGNVQKNMDFFNVDCRSRPGLMIISLKK